MSAIVDYEYYSTVYMGSEADAASFPALNAHASRMIAAMARWQVTEDNFSELPSIIQTQYKLAICSQVDFLAINGLDSVNSTSGGGFTVGKVTVHGQTASGKGGAMSGSISPAAIMYLEQTGLMNPAVPVVGQGVGGCVC
jgi:hypothetical protein